MTIKMIWFFFLRPTLFFPCQLLSDVTTKLKAPCFRAISIISSKEDEKIQIIDEKEIADIFDCKEKCHSQKFKILRNDPETKHIFPLPPLILFKRDKNKNFLVRSAFKSDNQPRELLNVHAHDAKLVLLFLTWLRSQDQIDPLKSLTTLHASRQMSSIA